MEGGGRTLWRRCLKPKEEEHCRYILTPMLGPLLSSIVLEGCSTWHTWTHAMKTDLRQTNIGYYIVFYPVHAVAVFGVVSCRQQQEIVSDADDGG